MFDDLTRIMQDMDTQATIDTNELEVIFDSTTTDQGLKVRSKDCLFSRGGSAPVELGNSDTEDEEQDHVETPPLLSRMTRVPATRLPQSLTRALLSGSFLLTLGTLIHHLQPWVQLPVAQQLLSELPQQHWVQLPTLCMGERDRGQAQD